MGRRPQQQSMSRRRDVESLELSLRDMERLSTWGKVLYAKGVKWRASDAELLMKLTLMREDLIRKRTA